MPSATTRPLPEETAVAIVGAGFGGLGMAIRLRQQGIEDFVVLERAGDVGGTWFANTYPGCQCDVPSNLYSFSFAPYPGWTHAYPEQPQIQRYLRECAEQFGVLEHIHLRCEMQEAAWDGDGARWQIQTPKGPLRAKALVVAPGLLSEPKAPPIPGIDAFEGTIFHTARWDHEHNLTGERVALVGTGATAIQVGPQMRPKVQRLYVFQRTPPWILPHPDRAIAPGLQRLYARAPVLQRLARRGVYVLREALAAGMTHHHALLRAFELIARAQLRVQVRDRAMRAQLTPGYRIGCKRVLLSNDWYPMLTAPNCGVVTAPIAEVRERAIVTADGVSRPVDSIIFATGFRPTDPAIAYRLRGAHGQLLSDVWNGSPQAYLGTVVSGFPNLFMLYGPNLNLGHSSIVYMLESQIHYVLQALSLLRRRDVAALDVRPAVQRAYNEDIARRLSTTVWDIGGCASWYLDANGRNSTMWPDYTFRYRRIVDSLNPGDYEIRHAPRPLTTA